MKRPELLAPAGNFENLQTAINAGCDAVYFGASSLNMRQGAKNFSIDDMKEVVKRCHSKNVKAYLTINTIIYENETNKMKKLISCALAAGIDAVICWDHSVIMECRKQGMEIHLSTQASVSNFDALKFYYDYGVKRFVLARELTLPMIKDIISKIKINGLDAEVECFIHGAMCISESGRCFMSSFVKCKSANRGECTQPCRRSYIIRDAEEGHEFKLENEFVMSPKDMCTIKILDKLIDAGINVFKIEGRIKSPEYVDVTVRSYNKAIDAYMNGKFTNELKDKLEKDLLSVYNRGFSNGFFMGVPINEWSANYGSLATEQRVLLGSVINYYKKINVFEFKLEAGESIKIGDELTISGPTTGLVRCKVKSMKNDDGDCTLAKQGDIVAISCPELVRAGDRVYILRKVETV